MKENVSEIQLFQIIQIFEFLFKLFFVPDVGGGVLCSMFSFHLKFWDFVLTATVWRAFHIPCGNCLLAQDFGCCY